ncbi:hypothetical protein AAE028_07895 [Sinorhizobium sp. CB9]
MVGQDFGITLVAAATSLMQTLGVVFLPFADEPESIPFSAVWSPFNQGAALRTLLDLASNGRVYSSAHLGQNCIPQARKPAIEIVAPETDISRAAFHNGPCDARLAKHAVVMGHRGLMHLDTLTDAGTVLLTGIDQPRQQAQANWIEPKNKAPMKVEMGD